MLSKLKTSAAIIQGAFLLVLLTLMSMPLYAQESTKPKENTVDLEASNNQEFFDTDNLQLHGFVALGVIDVNGSDFVNDDGSLSTELTEVGLNASWQLSSQFRLAGQVVYLDGGNRYEKGVRVDYALIDWSAIATENWQLNIYAGRSKNNHWLYSSTRTVPFARPSIILPQSVYFDGFRDIAVGHDGAGVKLSHSNDDYGNFDFNLTYGRSPISDEQAMNLLSEFATGNAKQEFDLQTSFYWQPAFSQWRFGLSLLDSDFTYQSAKPEKPDAFFDAEFSFQFYTLNALYEGEFWEFSGEVYQSRFKTTGFYFPQFHSDNIAQGYYFQTRYKITSDLTFLARYEDFYLNKEDKDGKKLEEESMGLIPAYFGYHKDTTLGLTYDFTSNLSLRLEYHWVHGAGRLTPVVVPNPRINDSEDWQLWAAQLMYWF
ncbi:hypothetical protein [Litorilituus lipolyticus]|uniref:hypothetical protein n=1 Tax=Litorilituus lipolyticus TaxID=2491017 RepID=UPI001BAA7F94|nr:hypothetical protein [Litorilituus lipolyticus]